MPGVSTEQPQSEERRERPKVGVSNSEAPIFDRGVPKVMRARAARESLRCKEPPQEHGA